jgi:hypothetical protein
MEPTLQQEAEAIRRLVVEHNMQPLEALEMVRQQERGRLLAQRIDPHSRIVAPKEQQS